jgi:hypothetical protein
VPRSWLCERLAASHTSSESRVYAVRKSPEICGPLAQRKTQTTAVAATISPPVMRKLNRPPRLRTHSADAKRPQPIPTSIIKW